jgi:hypothetical protein
VFNRSQIIDEFQFQTVPDAPVAAEEKIANPLFVTYCVQQRFVRKRTWRFVLSFYAFALGAERINSVRNRTISYRPRQQQ